MDQFPPPGGGSQPPTPVQPPFSGMPIPSMPAPPEPKKSGRKRLLIGVAVLLVVAIVVAIAVSSGGNKSATAASNSTSPSAVPRPTAPTTLTATTSPFKVVLTWSPSTGEFTGYRILRDGTSIDVVTSAETTYTDQKALPTSTYSYGVEAYTGGVNSEQAVLQVKTPKAPLAAARVTGVYDVRLKATSQYGYAGALGSFTDGWRFQPGCSTGACDVAWNELGHKDRGAKLKRSGTSYHGVDSSTVTGTCNGIKDYGTFDVTVKVTKAAALRDMWLATQIQGTVVVSSAASLGCLSSGVTYSFTAKLVN